MKIGIISDTHDHIDNLKKVQAEIKGKIDHLIHCGDACAPFMMAELDDFQIPTHVVFGNTADRERSPQKANETKFVKHYGDIADIEIDGVKILVNHYPNIAKAFASEGKHDLVCFGHTHVMSKEKVNGVLLVNPGEVMGSSGKITYAIFDTKTKEVSFHTIA